MPAKAISSLNWVEKGKPTKLAPLVNQIGAGHDGAAFDRRALVDQYLSFHRLLPFAAFYFFFNAAGLPVGMFYTSFVSPILFLWLYLKHHRFLSLKFFACLGPFLLVHFSYGVENRFEYLRALAHWWTVYIAVYAICVALARSTDLGRLIEQLILLNFVAAVLGILLFPTPLQKLFWRDTGETIVGSPHSLRLNLLNTEPSAYAELMIPLFVFAALRLIGKGNLRSVWYFAMIAMPFLLAQSFGGISIGFASVGITLLKGRKQLLRGIKSKAFFLLAGMASAILIAIPNPISMRVWQVIGGMDDSTKGRTIMAYVAAYTVAASKSLGWGVGLNQSKFVDFSAVVFGLEGHIPDLMAGLFAEFGAVGVLAILTVEVFLFARTHVRRSPFRFAMFVAAFINQFVGSYGTDVQQYLIWFLAFCPLFPEFEQEAPSAIELR